MNKLILAAFCAICMHVEAAEKPNIVLLFADDAGYGDFGFHGSHHFKTPHLDRLAQSGVLLSSFYVTDATCGPSRAGLMTGKYQQRFGFEENNVPSVMSQSSNLMERGFGQYNEHVHTRRCTGKWKTEVPFEMATGR